MIVSKRESDRIVLRPFRSALELAKREVVSELFKLRLTIM